MNYVFMESFYRDWPRRTYIPPQQNYEKIYEILNPNYRFYRVLEISINSNMKTIKNAYKRKVLESHPDKGGSEEEFRRIQEAYEVLFKYEKLERKN